jgi:DNA-binding transcriptional LysR family regulator
MELREIEVFLVLADELHFRRAAARLFLSQSRVSQLVRGLEERLGGKLFDRSSRQVRLTPLGEQFRDHVRPAFDALRAAVDVVRRGAAGIAGDLQLGLWSLPSGGPRLPQILSEFHRRHAECRVTVTETAQLRQLAELRSGTIDLLVLWLPVDDPDLTVGPTLTRESRVVEMAVDHPLATRGAVTLEDLGDYAVPSFFGVPAESLLALVPSHTPNGRPIRRHEPDVRSRTEMLQLVIAGDVVHPCAGSVPLYYQHPGVTYRPLNGLAPVRSALVWSTARETPAIRAFADVAADVLAHEPFASGTDKFSSEIETTEPRRPSR